MDRKIALIKENKEQLKLKKEFKVDKTRTPVKVIGIGDKALNILVFEASKFTKVPTWKQHWVSFEKDVKGGAPRAVMLIEEMVKSIPQTTL